MGYKGLANVCNFSISSLMLMGVVVIVFAFEECEFIFIAYRYDFTQGLVKPQCWYILHDLYWTVTTYAEYL